MFNKCARCTTLSSTACKYLTISSSSRQNFKFYTSNATINEKVPSNFNSSTNYIKDKFFHWFSWYEQLTGIHEVRLAQNKVLEAQERFSISQEKRREIHAELNEIRKQIRTIQDELFTVSKGDEKYLLLTTQEHNLVKEERRLCAKFDFCEKQERDYFNLLTSAVKDSHEQERIQANTTKYLSIIGSVVGTLLGIVGSTINNHMKLKKLNDLVLDLTDKTNERVAQAFDLLTSRIDRLFVEHQLTKLVTNGVTVDQVVDIALKYYGNELGSINKALNQLKDTDETIRKMYDTLEPRIKSLSSKDFLNNINAVKHQVSKYVDFTQQTDKETNVADDIKQTLKALNQLKDTNETVRKMYETLEPRIKSLSSTDFLNNANVVYHQVAGHAGFNQQTDEESNAKKIDVTRPTEKEKIDEETNAGKGDISDRTKMETSWVDDAKQLLNSSVISRLTSWFGSTSTVSKTRRQIDDSTEDRSLSNNKQDVISLDKKEEDYSNWYNWFILPVVFVMMKYFLGF